MSLVSLYNPSITKLSSYRKSYDSMIETVAEELKDSIKQNSFFVVDINHADGDAISTIMLLFLLDELGKEYEFFPYNGMHHLSFSTSIFPSKIIGKKIREGRHVTYITADNTPWTIFWEQAKKFYEKLESDKKPKLKIVVIDHHTWIESDKVPWIRMFEKESDSAPSTTYINAGWSKETIDNWWKRPDVPCTGEIMFDVTRSLVDSLYSEKRNDFIEEAIFPLLVATETDQRTEQAKNRYEIEDRKIHEVLKKVTSVKMPDRYRGEIMVPTYFVNIMNGALRVSGSLVDRPEWGIMDEEKIIHYPTHTVLYNLAKTTYFASKHRNVKALVVPPEQIGLDNHSYLSSILSLDREYSKIRSQIVNSFLVWNGNEYELRKGTAFKSEETNMFISMIYGDKRTIKRYGKTYDMSALLKIAPYMQYFLTEYPPIANSPIVSTSSFIIAAIEGDPREPNSYMHISLRVPKGKEYSYPLGLIAESASSYLKKRYQIGSGGLKSYIYENKKFGSESVQGGGHPTAAGIRIKQGIIDKERKENKEDEFEVIERIIKEGLRSALSQRL